MLCAEATSTVRRKYARSATSWSRPAKWLFVVDRLMLITSKPCSTAQRRPPRSAVPLPVNPAPRTRTLKSSQSFAIERTIPAQAVPWPQRSPSTSSTTEISSPSPTSTATAPASSPTSGWSASIPLSRMQTRTPLPVDPPHAHSRVTRPGHARGRAGLRGSRREAPHRERALRCRLGHGLMLRRAQRLNGLAGGVRGGLPEPPGLLRPLVLGGDREVHLDEAGGGPRSRLCQ